MKRVTKKIFRSLWAAFVFAACYAFTDSAAVQAGGIANPWSIRAPASLPLQPAGVPFVDPVFGTTLTRVSDSSSTGGFETQIYNQLQAFSSDNAYVLLDGSNGFIVRRMADFSLVTGLDTSGWNDPRWHPAQPHVIVHFDSNDDTVLRLMSTNIDTLATTTLYTFPPRYRYIRVPQSFDELSEDGRWLAGMATREDGVTVIFSFNIEDLALGAELPLPDLYAGPCRPDPQWGEVEPDWVAPSPLGSHLVVQWVRDGKSRCSGLETFDIQTGDFTGRVTDHHHHGDLGVDTDGVTQFFMTTELSSPQDSNRPALAMRLLPGRTGVSPPIYLQVMDWSDEDHISCRGPNGACLVSWGRLAGGYNRPFENELFLQHTDGSVLRLAHHRSSKCGYWVQPRATISRDGRYVAFASDWGEETQTSSCAVHGDPLGRGDPYIVDLGAAPVVSITAMDRVASEPGANLGRFRISRTGDPANELIVRYKVRGTAVNGTDYRRIRMRMIRIRAGRSSKIVGITPLDDSESEGRETVRIVLRNSGDGSYQLGKSRKAVVRILDND